MQRVPSQVSIPVIDPSLTEPALPPKEHSRQSFSKVKQIRASGVVVPATSMPEPVMDIDPEPAYCESGSEDELDSNESGRLSGSSYDGMLP